MAKPHGFVAPLQVNPAGYAGSGRGNAPYQGVTPVNTPAEPAPGTPKFQPVHPAQSGTHYAPGGPSKWLSTGLTDIGVGIGRITNIGAYPAVRL